MSIDREQLAKLPSAPIDWQTRAEEAERLVVELKSAVAHAQGDLFTSQLRVAALETEVEHLVDLLQEERLAGHGMADELLNEQIENGKLEATLARVREVAERQSQLSVSNGSWQSGARDVAGKVLRALEGGK